MMKFHKCTDTEFDEIYNLIYAIEWGDVGRLTLPSVASGASTVVYELESSNNKVKIKVSFSLLSGWHDNDMIVFIDLPNARYEYERRITESHRYYTTIVDLYEKLNNTFDDDIQYLKEGLGK